MVGSLPLNRSRNLSTYLGVIRRTFGPNVGVYNSLRECQSGGGSLSFEPVRGAALSFQMSLKIMDSNYNCNYFIYLCMQ